MCLDLVDLRKENIRLLQRIDSMREKEKDYLAQIDKVGGLYLKTVRSCC